MAWPRVEAADPVPGLTALSDRIARRVPRQKAPCLLPPADADLTDLLKAKVPRDLDRAAGGRKDMAQQHRILRYQLRGNSELAVLNALCISYLRRNTSHTSQAHLLFHRIWSEQGVALAPTLPVRWLISTLQTFFDHGKTEGQRIIGMAGYCYGNMMRIYEGERAIEGHPQDAVYERSECSDPAAYPGLERYELGGTDLMVNTHGLLLEASLEDRAAGVALQELLRRSKRGRNVFRRLDQSRKALGVEVAGFRSAWCFGKEPPA